MKTKLLSLTAAVAMLAGCASTSGPDVDNDPVRIEADTDTVPTWFIEFPQDTDEAIYAAASGLSDDLQFSIDKAIHDAKTILADKIGAKQTATIKRFVKDNSGGGMGNTVTATEKVSDSSFAGVDVSGYKIWGKAVYKDGGFYRTYVLLGLGEVEGRNSNITVLGVNKFDQKDQERVDEAFKEITLN